MPKKEKDYIGFDPVKWVDRLMSVNETSQFKNEEKEVISKALNNLYRELEKMTE